MRRWVGAILLFGALAACDVPLPGDVEQLPGKPQETVAQLPRDSRGMARAFIDVVERVEPVAERACARRAPRMNCDFLIVVDDRLDQPANAFQTIDENGRPIIAFTIALIASAQNPDELAFVMAHEAAHHIEGHIERQQRNAVLGAAVLGQLAGATGADASAVQSAQEIGAALGARTYSKEFELEADRLGAVIAHQAGYNPVLGAAFFNRIPDPGDRFLGTHPPNAERIAAVNQVAAGL